VSVVPVIMPPEKRHIGKGHNFSWFIPRSDGSKRPLGRPIIKDRIVQMATKIVIEPVFEADFLDSSFGVYRCSSLTVSINDFCVFVYTVVDICRSSDRTIKRTEFQQLFLDKKVEVFFC